MPTPNSARKTEFQTSELWLIRACLLLALGISLYLAWNSLQGGGIPGCGPESGCDKVLTSRWAYIFGVPLSLFAIPVYGALLAILRPQRTNWKFALPLAIVVLLSAVWLIGIQAFALRAFCKFCMIAHAAGGFAALLILRKALVQPGIAFAPAAIGAAAAAVLFTAQSFSPAPAPVQIRTTNAAPVLANVPAITNPPPLPPGVPLTPVTRETNVAVAAATNLVEPPKTTVAPQTFSIVNGQFPLDLTKVPVAGPIDAPKKVAKLFDYTCHHCRDLHHLLGDFRAKHSNEVAVISLPLPLDSSCNPVVRKTAPAHTNACHYAVMALAVFHADPTKFEQFSDFIYAPERPPDLATTRRYAEQLVGATNFLQAVSNTNVAYQIRRDIDIYMAAYRVSKSGALPQMHFGQGASIGAVQTREQLEKIMADNLGITSDSK